ncbi:hypothetical protein [Mesorhizobium sp. M1405]|uniref:hypothetical protein n=1 Tax=unclassified Mesorhizobium TaxID=325217 RepID=UPI003334A9EC
MPAFSGGIAVCQVCGVSVTQGEAGIHGKVTIIGVDLAKNSSTARDGISRISLEAFANSWRVTRHVSRMEACAGSHYCARVMVRPGHQPKLIAPHYVKSVHQPEKNDAADAEAIVEAAQRPTMRFVELKTEEQQPRSIMFRTGNSWSISALSWSTHCVRTLMSSV